MLKSLTIALVVCSLAVSQVKENPNSHSWGSHVGPHAPESGLFDLDWNQQGAIALQHAASKQWREAHPGWTISFDPRTNLPWRAFGPGIQVASQNAGAVEIETAAIAMKDTLAAASGLDPASFKFLIAARAGRMWYVDFEQIVSGVPVFNAGLTMRIDGNGKLVLWGGRLVHPEGVAAAPDLGAEGAIGIALNFLMLQGYADAQTKITPPKARLVVHVEDGRDRFTPALAWLVEFPTSAPVADWKIFVDAVTGAVRQHWNDVRECGEGDDDECIAEHGNPLFMTPLLASFSGTATGTVHDGVLPTVPPVLRNFNRLYVNCNGTNVLTDSVGFYSFNGGPASVPVTSTLDGDRVNTQNSAGIESAFAATGTTGTLDVPWTDTNSLLAERDAFFFTNQAHANLILHNPTETLFNSSLLANVNVSGTCNAYFTTSPLSINFYPAGGACVNTAYSASIVVHEYGHWVTVQTYQSHGKSVPGSLGEGYSDCQSGSVLDTPIVGDGWQGPGTMVRTMNNGCQYPSSCGTEVHSWGLVIGACYWHTRILFANAYGAAGKTMMDDYLYQHFHATPANQIESCMDMMLLNDNDANLANGTPDADKFYQGFTVQHGVPFPVPLIAIAHNPLKDTMDQVQNYQVHATATVLPVFPGVITTATTWYSTNNGPFVAVPMLPSGSEWVASIPVQPVGTTIGYYLEFQDSNSNVQKLPAGGAGSPFTFKTFRFSQFFFDGFEVASGWTSVQVATQNDWHNQAPNNPSHAYDPPTAFQGTKCWGNDLSPAGSNGNYANNVNNNLTSPILNCTGQSNVAIVYRRWLTIEDGLYDHARIRVSNNNGATYTTVWENPVGSGTQDLIDTAWVEHTVNISALADNQPQVRVRYELVSDPGVVRGGWTLDAFSLASANTTIPISNQGSNTPGQLGVIRTSGVAGDSILLAVDTVTATTYIDTIGTISLNPSSPSLLILFDGTQTLPPSGFLDLTFPVPALSGLTANFQGALVPMSGNPPILVTNLLVYTIL
jgi:Fungalysin/Thermolysin Propeptide Motif